MISTSAVLAQVDAGQLDLLLQTETYVICQPVLKEYLVSEYLVKSSGDPISTADERLPYMDLTDLREFMSRHSLERSDDSPEEVHLYNWTSGANGPMVFQTGFFVDYINDHLLQEVPYELVCLPPLKMCSMLYVGPLRWQEHSGLEAIPIEEVAANAGLVYTEQLYRELRHRFDWNHNLHVVEVEISVQ